MTMNAIAIAIGAGAYIVVPPPTFSIAFSDSGAGAVNLTPAAGTGSATFTRATSATCWGSTGLLLTVGTGVARSTYTELTGAAYLGYLAEEARTNNCLQNRDFTNAAWTKTTMTAALDQTGIDGTASSCSSLLATAGNATAAQSITIAAVNRPFSVYIKRLTGTGNIDLSQDGASFTTQTVANDGNFHRCVLQASQLNPTLTIRLATNGDKIAVDYASLEDHGGGAAAFVTTPIATTTVAVTRNADVLTFPKASNTSDAAGTVAAEVTTPAGVTVICAIVGGTSTTASDPLTKNNNNKVITADNSGTNTVSSTGTWTDTAVHKCASKWGSSLLAAALDGVVNSNGSYSGTIWPTAINVGTGQGGANWLNGTIRKLRIWTVTLTDSQIGTL